MAKNQPGASPKKVTNQSAGFKTRRSLCNMLENHGDGLRGGVAMRRQQEDATEAATKGVSPDTYGRCVGNIYYRRLPSKRGSPLEPNTYPALLPPKTERTMRPQRIVGSLALQDPRSTLPAEPGLAARLRGVIEPTPGQPRSYAHGGVDPVCPPGLQVPLKRGGERTGGWLLPLVNFGPAELLAHNFRDARDDPEAEWVAAMVMASRLKMEAPRSEKRKGDTVGDYGGSHETLNFTTSVEAQLAGVDVGKYKHGALEKDALSHTDLGQRRRLRNGNHRELLNKGKDQRTADEWLMHLLYSMAGVDVELFYPVAVLLCGARTRCVTAM